MGLLELINKRRDAKAERQIAPSAPTPPFDAHEPAFAKSRVTGRVAAWIDQLQRDPSAEERSADERRALLLQELNRTVAESPDDVPIKYVIDRLNRHWDD